MYHIVPMSVNTYKEQQTNVLKCVQTTHKMAAAHIIVCVILIKQVLWNFVQNPKSSLVRFHLTIHTSVTLEYSYDILVFNFYVFTTLCECMSNNAMLMFLLLFLVIKEYCPEYDPIGRTIQKDIYTLCKPSDPLEKVYRSSDLFFCK